VRPLLTLSTNGRGPIRPGEEIRWVDACGRGYRRAVLELQRLRADHEQALLDFEVTNRAWFTRSISDRGDDYFDQFADRLAALVAEQDAGTSAFYVLVEDGAVVGRFNLYDIAEGTADVGYRVAEHVAGRGVATDALRQLCRLAVEQHGIRLLRAATSDENAASRRVLAKAGFVPVGRADPADIGGRQGSWFELGLEACAEGQALPTSSA
jgi:ribosomal-protein-alanine N-acetyltransferase